MKVYLAGPIMGCTDEQCKDWREYAKKKLPQTLDPMDRDYRGKEGDNSVPIVEGDKEDINNATILLVNFPKPSTGTCMEILYAWEMGKYIVAVVPEGEKISPWLSYHTHFITNTFDEAIEHILFEVKPRESKQRSDVEETVALYTTVFQFGQQMKHKLLKKKGEGRRGWDDASCLEWLKNSLKDHVEKGDMVDVANLAMFIWNLQRK